MYVLYYLGGPLDLTKQARQGDGPNGAIIRVAEAVPMQVRNYMAGEEIEYEKPLVHLYRILPVPPTGSSHFDCREKLFVAVWLGKE